MDDNGNGALIPLHASVQWASGAEKSRRETEQREIRKVEEELEKAFHFSADSESDCLTGSGTATITGKSLRRDRDTDRDSVAQVLYIY